MKIVAVTGGGRGIGRAIALRFAKAGYGVSIADIDEEPGREWIETLQGLGAEALFHRADVSQPQDVEEWMRATVEKFGCPDVLINNAGISRNRPFLDLSVDDFDRVTAVNLRGTFLCSQAAARRMIDRGAGGAIVNIASTRALCQSRTPRRIPRPRGASSPSPTQWP